MTSTRSNRSSRTVTLAVFAAALLTLPAILQATTGYSAPADDPSSGARSERYREGQRALADERWPEAARAFAAVVESRAPESDAALYWLAYAEWQQQRKREALEALRQLLSGHPGSAWADDAQALEVEIRGGRAGKGGSPEQVADEELKLYALDALMQVEPERAVPVLERILAGDHSLKLKERALFVLSQSDSTRAREILLRVARTGSPSGLRVEAVRALGIAGEAEDLAALATLAGEAGAPREVREALVEAYLIADQGGALLELAKIDPDPRIRAKAIEALGAMEQLPALRSLWSVEKDPQLRRKLLEAFGIAGDVETLALAARQDGDPQVRRKAIEGLAIADSPAAARELRALYGQLADHGDKRKVLEAFMIQDDARSLIEIFRVEKDLQLKKEIVQQLSMLDDPAATELLFGLLEDKP